MQLNNTIYGFSLGNIGRVLYDLKNIDCCYMIYPNNINHYLDILIHDQPSYILGLGSYSDTNQDQIRIKTKFSNQLRNNYIEGENYAQLEIQPFLNHHSQMKLSNIIDNSYYNIVSWKIVQLINKQLPNSRYTFLHIPKTMKIKTASQIVDTALLKLFSKSSIPIPSR